MIRVLRSNQAIIVKSLRNFKLAYSDFLEGIADLSLAKAERIRKAMQASVGANSDRLSRLSIKEISQDILELRKR